MVNQISLLPPPDNDPNRDEITGRRDIKLCKRHRKWGFNMNELDLDFIEYNDDALPLAIIEYKVAFPLFPDRPNIDRKIKALTILAKKAELPALLTYYNPDFKYWMPFSLNEYLNIPGGRYTEYEYVQLLYRIRKEEIPPEVSQFVHGGGFK